MLDLEYRWYEGGEGFPYLKCPGMRMPTLWDFIEKNHDKLQPAARIKNEPAPIATAIMKKANKVKKEAAQEMLEAVQIRELATEQMDNAQGILGEARRLEEALEQKRAAVGAREAAATIREEQLQAKEDAAKAKADELEAKAEELEAKAEELEAKAREAESKAAELAKEEKSLKEKAKETYERERKVGEKERQARKKEEVARREEASKARFVTALSELVCPRLRPSDPHGVEALVSGMKREPQCAVHVCTRTSDPISKRLLGATLSQGSKYVLLQVCDEDVQTNHKIQAFSEEYAFKCEAALYFSVSHHRHIDTLPLSPSSQARHSGYFLYKLTGKIPNETIQEPKRRKKTLADAPPDAAAPASG
jgi:myosin heavy subunit